MLLLARALLRTESELLASVTESLDELDTVSLMVYALEYDDHAVANMLRDHSPWCPLQEMHLLHFAAAHGCMRAVYALRKSAKPAFGKAYKPLEDKEEDAIDSIAPCRQLMAWVSSFRAYRFPEGVMYQAAKQGDLSVLRWLHSTTEYTPFLAVEHAALAGHLASAQWLAEHAHEASATSASAGRSRVPVEVTVPFDETLGIFAWRANTAASYIDSTTIGQQLRRLVRRRGFVWMDGGSVRIASLRTGSSYGSDQLHDPVVYAAEEGSIELLEVLKRSKDAHNWSFSQRALVHAVASDQLEVAQWLINNKDDPALVPVTELVATAMDCNNAQILKWLDASFELHEIPFESVRNAVHGGRLDAVIWACERFPDLCIDEDLLCLHKGFPPADVAMWLHEHKGLRLDPQMLPLFITCGDGDLLKRFLDCCSVMGHQLEIGFQEFENACEYGSAETVQYLAETHHAVSDRAVHLATGSGNVDTAKWLFSAGERGWNLQLCGVLRLARMGEWELLKDFASSGQVDDRVHCFWRLSLSYFEQSKVDYYPHFLHGDRHKDWPYATQLAQWMLANFPDKITHARSLGAWASQNGHSAIVRQLIDAEYPTIFATANFKRFLQSTRDGELVQIFLERRPELLSYRVFQWSAEHKHKPLLKFLFASVHQSDAGGVGSSVTFEKSLQVVVTTASKHGYLGLLKWVQLNISPRSTLVNPWTSARHGHVRILEWLRESGTMDESQLPAAVQASVRFGHLAVLKWYERIGRAYQFTEQELQCAAKRRDGELVQWILRKQPALETEMLALEHHAKWFLTHRRIFDE